MELSLSATVARRGVELDVHLDGATQVAVLGHNGAGKSTLLHLLAGGLRPDHGHARLDGRTLFDLPPNGRRRWLSAPERGIALLGQDPLLFPHLSVLDNVAFGPQARGRRRADARRAAEHWLGEVGAEAFAGRRPAQLSGGEAQRVALARALAAEPRLLLLDEPMAALDVAVAPQLRQVLRRVLAGRPTLVVTHDLLDALLLSDQLVVLDGGRVAESGPTQDVLRRPRTPFAARLAGLNLVQGTARHGGLVDEHGWVLQGVQQATTTPGEPAVAAFAPRTVSVYREQHAGSPRNALPVTLTELEPLGDVVRVRGRTRDGLVLAADVTVAAVAELDLQPGGDAVFVVKATAVDLYPA